MGIKRHPSYTGNISVGGTHFLQLATIKKTTNVGLSIGNFVQKDIKMIGDRIGRSVRLEDIFYDRIGDRIGHFFVFGTPLALKPLWKNRDPSLPGLSFFIAEMISLILSSASRFRLNLNLAGLIQA